MTWALKRQMSFVGIFAVLIIILGYLFISPYFNQVPTCNNDKQDGDETGVDCGGSCALACSFEVDKLSVIWSRAFEVVPGRYNAVAFVENQNRNKAINKINYRFRFADENNVYVGKRDGSTFIPPSGEFAIFEPAVDTGHSVPVYTTFQFTEVPQWIQVLQDKINQLQVTVSSINLTNPDTTPVLSAVVKNNSLFIIPEVSVVAILYDANHNAVSTSSTYIDQLSAEESREVTFTWPKPLPSEIVSQDIIPIYNIFSVKLK